jgi:hypothetical protein
MDRWMERLNLIRRTNRNLPQTATHINISPPFTRGSRGIHRKPVPPKGNIKKSFKGKSAEIQSFHPDTPTNHSFPQNLYHVSQYQNNPGFHGTRTSCPPSTHGMGTIYPPSVHPHTFSGPTTQSPFINGPYLNGSYYTTIRVILIPLNNIQGTNNKGTKARY